MSDNGLNGDFDKHRLSLTETDFTAIDKDSNSRLSLLELTLAAQNGNFTNEKKDAVEGLKVYLEQFPDYYADAERDVHKVIPSWFTVDSAMSELSRNDFDTIDADRNGVLSRDELSGSTDIEALSKMSKHAANVLLNGIENGAGDHRSIVTRNHINNWHNLNPEFKTWSLESLSATAMNTSDHGQAISAAKEFVQRAEFILPTDEVSSKMIPSIQLLQNAIAANKNITQKPDGTYAIGDDPLTDEQRSRMHRAIISDLQILDYDVQMRRILSERHAGSGERDQSDKWAESAIAKSDGLTRKTATPDGDVSVIDLIKREQRLLDADIKSGRIGSDFLVYANWLKETAMVSPIEARMDVAIKSLGLRVRVNSDHTREFGFDTSSPSFQIDRAERMEREARQLTKDILEFDPALANQPEAYRHVLLFGQSWKELDPKGKYNFYRDADGNGKSDLIERLGELKTYNDNQAGPHRKYLPY